MDLRLLLTFVTVAEQGSVSKAASRLHVSQPALSRQLGLLQHKLGIRLFDRVGRRLLLTSAGEQLLGDCRRLLGQTDALIERARLLQRANTGVLRIAASPVQIESVLSTFLHRYARHYPDVQVKLIEAVVPDIVPMLERGEIQLAILLEAVRPDERYFGSYPVPPLEIVAVCHPSFPLRGGSKIDVHQLAPHPLLLLDTSFLIRRKFDAVCGLAALKPNILIESHVPSNLLALAEAGHGVAIIQSVVPTHRYTLRSVRITHEGNPLREPLAVVWDKRRALPRFTQDFCELLAAHMRELFPITGRAAALRHPSSSRTARSA
jgi:DNA-binding transcriptional LysR family regulator